MYFRSITIGQSYTGKSHLCCCWCCYECTARVTMLQQTSDIFTGIALYCGDNDFIIRTFEIHVEMQHM